MQSYFFVKNINFLKNWLGVLLFLLKVGSRRQINFKFQKKEFVENLNKIIGKEYLCMESWDKKI